MKILKNIVGNPLLKKSLVDSNYYLISQAASKLLTVMVIPILARTVSIEEFGYYDAFLLFSNFLLLVVTLGIDSGIGVFVVENKGRVEKLRFLFTFSLLAGTCITFILFLTGLAILPFYEFISKNLYTLLFLNLLFGFFSYSAFNFLRWLGNSKVASIVTFFTNSMGVLLGLLFLYLADDKSIFSFLVGLVLGTFMSCVICLYHTRKYISFFRLNDFKSEIKDLLIVSLPFLPNYLINNLLLISDRFLIMHFLGSYAYGQYAMVMRISQIPSFFIQVLNKGFLPVLFHNFETDQGKRYNRKVFSTYIYCIIPIFIITILFSKQLLFIFGGESYSEVANLIPLVILSVLFFGSMGFNGFGYSLKRKTLQITYITLFSIIVNAILTLLMINSYGLSAVAIAIMVVSASSSIIYTYFSERLYKIGYSITQMLVVFALLSVCAIFYTMVLI